jgi:hypothetical protein
VGKGAPKYLLVTAIEPGEGTGDGDVEQFFDEVWFSLIFEVKVPKRNES